MDPTENPSGPEPLEAAHRPEAPLSFPAAVLALLVGLDLERLAQVARALGVATGGSRAEVAMRVASRAVESPDALERLVGLLATEELRLACGEVLGLPAGGARSAIVRRLAGWLLQLLREGAACA